MLCLVRNALYVLKSNLHRLGDWESPLAMQANGMSEK